MAQDRGKSEGGSGKAKRGSHGDEKNAHEKDEEGGQIKGAMERGANGDGRRGRRW